MNARSSALGRCKDSFATQCDDHESGTSAQQFLRASGGVCVPGGGPKFIRIGGDNGRTVVACLEKGIPVGIHDQGTAR